DHLQRQPDLAGLPEKEKAVLLKALAKEPADRYPTCQAFVQALERALDVTPLPSTGSGRGLAVGLEASDADESSVSMPGAGPAWRQPPAPARTSPGVWLVSLMGAIVLAVGLAAVLRYFLWPPAAPEPSLSLDLEKRALTLTSGGTESLVVRLQREHVADD